MRKVKVIIPWLLSVIFPVIPIFFIYNSNAAYLRWWHMLITAGILSFLSILILLLLSKIFKATLPAVLATMAFWFLFFAYGVTYNALLPQFEKIGFGNVILLPICGILFIASCLLIRRLTKHVKTDAAIPFLGFFTAVLLLFNLFSFVRNAAYQSARIQVLSADLPEVVDPSLPIPNIYWIHPDGMLSFDAVEQYFGDPQEDFAEGLEARGFTINKKARFEANHTTVQATAALMCPNFYDTILFDHVSNTQQAFEEDGQFLETLPAQYLSDVLCYNELTRGMQGKGYKTATISIRTHAFPLITDYYYDLIQASSPYIEHPDDSLALLYKKNEYITSYMEIMEKTTPFSILYSVVDRASVIGFLGDSFDNYPFQPLGTNIDTGPLMMTHPEDQADRESNARLIRDELMMQSLADITDKQLSAPLFCIVQYMTPHYPFYLQSDGRINDSDPEDLSSYLGNHQYSAKLLLNMVDMILEQDPSAVIVLQSDHGIHAYDYKELMTYFDITKEETLDIYNGVMSAVRIPEAYGRLEEGLNPLNISRYLINNFVGANYEYLTEGNYIR